MQEGGKQIAYFYDKILAEEETELDVDGSAVLETEVNARDTPIHKYCGMRRDAISPALDDRAMNSHIRVTLNVVLPASKLPQTLSA